MRRLFYWLGLEVLFSLFLPFACTSNTSQREEKPSELLYISHTDSIFFQENILPLAKELQEMPADSLLLSIADFFLGTPYEAHTLEHTPEGVVVCFNALDCTTYWEVVLALYDWIRSASSYTLESYIHSLQNIRFRSSHIKDYSSRLHYTSEWLAHNERQARLRDLTKELGGLMLEKDICFMTTYADKYPALSDSSVYAGIAQNEKDLVGQVFYYLPKEQIHTVARAIKDGDLIAFITNIPLLDASHVGFARWREEVLHLQHASSKGKQVMISEESLIDYVYSQKHLIGLRVARICDSSDPKY